MPVLGRTGSVEFNRKASYSQVFNRTDIDVTGNRLKGLTTEAITGDRVELFAPTGLPFDFNGDGYADAPGAHAMYAEAGFRLGPRTEHRMVISSNFYTVNDQPFYDTPETTGLTTTATLYIWVNELGYVRFYPTFADAVNQTNVIKLYDETDGFTLTSKLENTFAIFGQITKYQLTAGRQSLDIEAIGHEFGEAVAGTVTGSGSIDCFFSYRPDPNQGGNKALTLFLYRLALKTISGQDGIAKFYINKGESEGESVYYTSSIVITRSALNIQPDALVAGTIDFVTSGEIALKVE